MKRALSKKNIWDAVPGSVKQSLRPLIGLVQPSVLLGGAFREWRGRVDAADTWTPDAIEQFQMQSLRPVLDVASQTPFYRKVFQDAGVRPDEFTCIRDLQQLPMIDKSALREHQNDMLAHNGNAPDVDYVSTGGSGGEPLSFLINASRSSVEYAHLTSGWARIGYDLGTPQAVLRGQVISSNSMGFPYEYDPILRRHNYSNFHMTDDVLTKYFEHIARIGPCFLHTYPSSLNIVMRFFERAGETPPGNIRGILLGSEIVYPDDRARAESLFGCRVFSYYGQSEKVVLAAECEHTTDYHVFPTYGICELVDDNGEPVDEPGVIGEIVGTGFINTVTPFLRYRTGDFAEYVGEHCSACGRHQKILRSITGHRTQEVLVATDGGHIPWVACNLHSDAFEHVRQFQFHQAEPGVATLKLVPADSFDESDQTKIARDLGERLGERLQFRIQLVEDIPLTARGKSVYVDQKLDITA